MKGHRKIEEISLLLTILFSGRATVLCYNDKTGNTVKLKVKKKENVYWVFLEDLYVGYTDKTIFFVKSDSSPKLQKIITWLWPRIIADTIPDSLSFFYFYESSLCGLCGKTLTDEESITAGFGPDCRKKLGI